MISHRNEGKYHYMNFKDLQLSPLLLKALEEKGYNPIDQLVGYLLSGDPTYITSHDDARTKLRRFERYELIEELVVKYLEKNTK